MLHNSNFGCSELRISDIVGGVRFGVMVIRLLRIRTIVGGRGRGRVWVSVLVLALALVLVLVLVHVTCTF